VGPIDPFCMDYWSTPMPPPSALKIDVLLKKDTPVKKDSIKTFDSIKVQKAPSAKSNHPFPQAYLADFLTAIQGTTHNQVLLVELLRKQYTL
jgi:hypothetical protein